MDQKRTTNAFIGSAIERVEDFRLLRGRGQFVDDLARENLLHAVILRSSVAHGRIRSIDTAAARARPGVHAVITAADIGAAIPSIPLRQDSSPAFKPFEQPVIAHDKVRYVGEPVAVVLAESAAAAEDALEAITLAIEPSPAVVTSPAAATDDILLFEAAGTNRALTLTGVRGDADGAFSGAAYVRRETFAVQRHGAVPIEPRGLLAEWDGALGRLTVFGAAAFLNRRILAADGVIRKRDPDGGKRRRRGLRRARRILSGRFSDPVCGAPHRPTGQMDRGSARAPHRHQSCPQCRMRARDRLRRGWHDPRAARTRLDRPRRLQIGRAHV